MPGPSGVSKSALLSFFNTIVPMESILAQKGELVDILQTRNP